VKFGSSARPALSALARRIEFVAETTASLPRRAIAVWYASGVEWGKERRIGRSDLGALLASFLDLGIPSDLILAWPFSRFGIEPLH
jgi:hypothetical protein